MKRLFAMLHFVGLFLCAQAQTLIPFQGRLTDQDGKPYTDSQYTIVFQIYEQAVGDRPVWHERHERVGVINGTINVFLGSISPLTAVNFSTTRYLGITVDGDNNPNSPDPEMVPRQIIIPAFWAKNSDKLGGFGWNDLLAEGSTNPVTGSINGNKILKDSITGAQIRSGTIIGSKIAEGAIAQTHLSDGSIGSASLASGGVTFEKLKGRVLTNAVADGGNIASTRLTLNRPVDSKDAYTEAVEYLTVRTTGRPVVIVLTANSTGAAIILGQGPNYPTVPFELNLELLRGRDPISGYTYRLAGNEIFSGASGMDLRIPASLFFLDTPPAGEHTYHLRHKEGGAYTSILFSEIKFIAFEL